MVKGKEIIAVIPPDKNIYGLAVDVGTTKLAAYLVDLVSGETVSKAGAMNPQIAYGEDVISRISFATDKEDGAKILQQKLVATLNNLIETMTREAGISCGQVVDAVIVGNTAMHHLLAGLEVKQLGEAPYVPSMSASTGNSGDFNWFEYRPRRLDFPAAKHRWLRGSRPCCHAPGCEGSPRQARSPHDRFP